MYMYAFVFLYLHICMHICLSMYVEAFIFMYMYIYISTYRLTGNVFLFGIYTRELSEVNHNHSQRAE